MANECKENMEKMKERYNEANQEMEAAYQPLFEMLMDTKTLMLRRNEETYRSAKAKTMEMLEYLRNIYREIREDEDPPQQTPVFYEVGTSSEELPSTRLPESGVESILSKLKTIVANHTDWLERMERHLIYEAGVDQEYIKFVANFQTVNSVLDR